MLASLSIRDFIIVEQLTLDFAAGFTVLTGETGAGKSILIDALQFALGERAQPDTVREGSSRAEVAVEFAAGPAARDWLARNDLASGEDGTEPLLLRRTLDSSGRSRCFINGSPVSTGQLRELGEHLLDVHGQHEHQSLLRGPAQQDLLDTLGGLQDSARAVAAAHAGWRAAAAACAQAQALRDAAAAQSAELRLLLDDLETLAPEPGEWERVEQEQKRLAHGAALLEGARAALDGIAESEDAIGPRLSRISARLGTLSAYDERLGPALTALASVDIHLDEASRALGQYLADGDLDEGRLAQVEERIAALHAVGRKWRCAPGQLPELLARSRERLLGLEAAQDLDRLRADEALAQAHYQAQARVLSEGRAAAAQHMGTEVTRAMQDLAMAGGSFAVRLNPCEPSAGGVERAEFLVCGHPGATLRPLAKVASGGELSRIGLAISVIAATGNGVATLIFDEVDAGIGGTVAATVGSLLHALGRARQVFCVTHLPQVASFGDQHLSVRKATDAQGRTISSTVALTGEDRVQEIARMLGGTEITSLTLRHAREMLRRA